MCFGGGQAATITAPDYGAYEREFDLQRSAIEQSMNNSSRLMQGQLDAALRQQQAVSTQALEQKKTLAEKTQAEVSRLTALMGAPPPEKGASAPAMGSERGLTTKKGKSALRIERTVASSSGQGAGLNIT
jgi:hypothetical protein